MSRLELSIIENIGPNNLRDFLKAKLAQATDVTISVAFVTKAGLKEIIQPLREVAAHGQVRLITGLYQHFTEPSALRLLLETQAQVPDKFSVHLSTERQFHRKCYFIAARRRATLVVGSSNLTFDALVSAGELNLAVSLPKNSPLLKRFISDFDQEWSKWSVPLVRRHVEKYEQARPKPTLGTAVTLTELKAVLGTPSSHRASSPHTTTKDQNITSKKYWRDYHDGVMKESTDRIIASHTNWEKRQYLWYDMGRGFRLTVPYQIGDELFIFDFNDKRLFSATVKGNTVTPYPTADGRKFVAYAVSSGRSRPFGAALWKGLRELGITKRSAKNHQFVELSPGEVRQLRKLIRNT